MCFKWIQSVRRIHDDVATRCEDTVRLVDGAPVVVDVLDDLVQQDDVEGAVIERQFFRRRDTQIR